MTEAEIIEKEQPEKALIALVPSSNKDLTEGSEEGLERNPAAVYLARLRPSGRRGMLHALNVMARLVSGERRDAFSLPWQDLRYQHTAAIAAALVEQYRPATVNQMLSALRGVLSQAENLGLMSAEDYRRAVKIKSVKASTLPRGRALSAGEIRALLEICSHDASPLGARDAAAIAVLYGAGLRRSELVKLDLADYEPESGALTVRGGKGGKDRLTYLGEGVAAALDDWLVLRGKAAGPLFCPVRKGGHIAIKRLVAQSALDLLQARGLEAGLQPFSPHDLRRTFISDLLDAGADIATVQKLAGHADILTTARYDRRGEVAKKRAAGLLHLPYQKRK